jgi:hypothetical protein
MAIWRARISTLACGLTTQAPAIRAARATAASLLAANQTGGCGLCTGFTTIRAFVRW